MAAVLVAPAWWTRNRRFAATPRMPAPIRGEGPRQFHRVKWKFPTGDRIVSSPVYANGAIYFGGDDGNVYAVDAADGHQLWKRSTGGPVAATPAVADGVVYVGSYDGKFYALDARTGAMRWRIATGGERRFEAKGLHGLQPKNQTIADPFDVYLSSPVLGGGSVYFGSGDGNVYALDAVSGEAEMEIPRPAMSCTLRPRTRTAPCSSAAGTATSTRSTPRRARRNGASTAARIR